MKLASHNSWSYLKPKKWLVKLFSFTARCQEVDIQEQYSKYDVRCFDLRVRFKNDTLIVAHNKAEYNITAQELEDHLKWLDSKGDVAVRVILEVRCKKEYTELQCSKFRVYCNSITKDFPNIKFWGGRNLYNWEKEYNFEYSPSYEEKHSSVTSPKLIDDWYPRLYAKKNNRKNIFKGTEMEYLMIDFVNLK